jgi:SAM-dependent methyltransferase
MQDRTEKLPENSADHYKLKANIFHARWYSLKQLRKLIELAINQYILPKAQSKQVHLADFGCGTKPYLSLFDSDKIKYSGIDLAWNPHADVIIGTDSKVEASDETFDIVLSTQVLEHVEDPKGYLLEARRILQKDGLLVLTTHGTWMYHPDPTDYWRWTSAGLQKIVIDAGFEVICFKGMLGRMATGLHLFQDGLQFKFPVFMRPLITMPLQLLIALADKLQQDKVRDMDACNYLIIAKKK